MSNAPLIWPTGVLLLSQVCVGLAQESTSDARPTPLQQFAVDGLSIGQPLMNGSLDLVTEVFGLPNLIEIRHADARWDIDRRETPADWIYSGMVITTYYYQDGVARQDESGKFNLAPGPYYESDIVTGIRVYDEGVTVLFDLGVGADEAAILDRLGMPERYDASFDVLLYRDVLAVGTRGSNIDVEFRLDAPGGKIREISWTRAPWH